MAYPVLHSLGFPQPSLLAAMLELWTLCMMVGISVKFRRHQLEDGWRVGLHKIVSMLIALALPLGYLALSVLLPLPLTLKSVALCVAAGSLLMAGYRALRPE